MTELNNLRGIQVVANQTVVQAQAQANANVAKAGGESQAIRIITSQLRQDPQYLQWQAINRWNGQLPYSLGGGGEHSRFSNYRNLRRLPLQQEATKSI